MEDRSDWPCERIRRHSLQDPGGQNAYLSRLCVDLPQRAAYFILVSINCDHEQTSQMPTLWTQHRQLDYANNSVGSGRRWTARIVGITFTFTAALDSCSMTASTGASNSYLKEPAA